MGKAHSYQCAKSKPNPKADADGNRKVEPRLKQSQKRKPKTKGGKQMAQYHATGSISHNAVATFAYDYRAKLKDPLTGKMLNYAHKEDLLYSNSIMCENAPKGWSKNPALCWKSVAEREGLIDPRTGKPTQHARKIEFALPKELTKEQQIKICDKLAKFYAKMGMCVSYGIHKTKNGNVHCHMILTMRQLDKKGNWVEAKNKSVLALDKNGERIPQLDKKKVEQWEKEHNVKFDLDKATQEDKEFCQKVRERKNKGKEKMWVRDVVNVSGWDSGEFYQKNVRKKIETLCNAGLRLAGSNERVSCLSYAQRGIKKLPTIHEGVGKKAAERATYNKRVKEYNLKIENWEELQEELFARLQAKEEKRDTKEENQTRENTPTSAEIDKFFDAKVAEFGQDGMLRIPPKTGKHEYFGKVILNKNDGSFLQEMTDKNGNVRGILLHKGDSLDAAGKHTALFCDTSVVVSYNNGNATVEEFVPGRVSAQTKQKTKNNDFER